MRSFAKFLRLIPVIRMRTSFRRCERALTDCVTGACLCSTPKASAASTAKSSHSKKVRQSSPIIYKCQLFPSRRGSALQFNSSGSNNVATGTNALQSNTTGIDNLATGTNALQSNVDGHDNVASGFRAMISNTSGC